MRVLICLLAATAYPGADARAVSLSIIPGGIGSPNFFRVTARDGSSPFNDAFVPSQVPFADAHTIADGGSSSSASYELNDAGLSVVVSEHVRTGNRTAEARSRGVLRFAVDTDTSFSLSGEYDTSGGAEDLVLLEISLLDVTSNSFLFFNSQTSQRTSDEHFFVGEAEGDASNTLIGSPVGELIAGHEYRLIYDFLIAEFLIGPSAPASATGFLLFAVPEPGAALLLLGPSGIALLYRRRRLRHPSP